MVAYPLEVHVTDMARWLEHRKDTGERTFLFLGARAGGLFRSKTLYGTSQYFSPRIFKNMSWTEQFAECYRVLHEQNFSRSDINTILNASLQGLSISEVDVAVAELVQSGIFDTIISTNIDDLLTKAFAKVGMRELYDFQILTPQQGFSDNMITSTLPCTLIKAFGDVTAEEANPVRYDLYLERREYLKKFLASCLRDNLLILGYDPFWDRGIEALLPAEGQELWYVNEERIYPLVLPALEKRRGKYIVGGEGNYERFIQSLHWYLTREKPLDHHFTENQVILLPDISGLSPAPIERQQPVQLTPQPYTIEEEFSALEDQIGQRRQIFIGYSQKDRRHFQQLQTHLATYKREKLVDIWNEANIAAGKKWREELQKAFDVTRVAILLISAEFLASDFIAENILPPLLRAAEAGGAIILPVILSDCVFEDTPLQQFQSFNNPSEPLALKRPVDRHKIWADLVRYVITLIKNV